MWFKNLRTYFLSTPWSKFDAQRVDAFVWRADRPGDNLETQTLGWVSRRDGGALSHVVND